MFLSPGTLFVFVIILYFVIRDAVRDGQRQALWNSQQAVPLLSKKTSAQREAEGMAAACPQRPWPTFTTPEAWLRQYRPKGFVNAEDEAQCQEMFQLLAQPKG